MIIICIILAETFCAIQRHHLELKKQLPTGANANRIADNTATAVGRQVPSEGTRQPRAAPGNAQRAQVNQAGKRAVVELDARAVGYCERAQLADGQRILELGCGWGSMSLFMAARYPNAIVHVVSNSRTQKQFIDERAAERGITNLTVITANMADEAFAPPKAGSYDRIVSIEMFEHMKARWYRSFLRATLR